MSKRVVFSLAVLASLLLLAACSGGGAQPAAPAAGAAGGNADNGKALFAKTVLGKSPGCVTCHSLEKGKTLVGPSMAGIATEAEKTIKDAEYKGTAKSAAEFMRESIVKPNVYVTKGFAQGIMPADYTGLSEQELNDLVAYLVSLK
jgi:cytochrome c2